MGSILYESAGGQSAGGDEELDEELNANWVAELDTVATACGPSRKTVDLFATADALAVRPMSEGMTDVPRPLRTFSTSQAAFNLNRKPDIARISIDLLAEMYNLPDLHPALLDFFSEHLQNPSKSIHRIGGRRRNEANTQLPFDHVAVWFSLRIQTRSTDDGSLITDPRRLVAMPSSELWPLGRYDTALFVDDGTDRTTSPEVGLDGKFFR